MRIAEGSQPCGIMHSVTIEILRGANDAPLRMTACCCVWLTGKMLSHEKFGPRLRGNPITFSEATAIVAMA
jgi:hypothetical protein